MTARSSTLVERASYTGPVDQAARKVERRLQAPLQHYMVDIQSLKRGNTRLGFHKVEGRMLAVGCSRMAGMVGHEWLVRGYARKVYERMEEHRVDTQHRSQALEPDDGTAVPAAVAED